MKKLAALAIFTLALTGCASEPVDTTTVRLATHDSFVMTDEQIAEFEESTGYQLELVKVGDTGTLTNQLVLTKDAPFADAVYGIDNTFLSVAQENKIAESFDEINYGDVCFNYDAEWFEATKVTPPTSWRDLGNEEYKNLTVISNPILSSPGMAFLITTYAGFESKAETFAYWRSLRDNGVKIAPSWSDAYFTEFTRYGGKYPIVLSYASSPAAELVNGVENSKALRDECFRQFEYAAVLNKAKNPEGGKAVLEFLKSKSFQEGLAWNMFVYPSSDVELPEEFKSTGAPANSTLGGDLDFAANRDQWLKDWSDVFDN
ncbi:MAG: thiamine ABC transporter substrate-binding protein [Actinobacteria bacterium]|jgi:thiamine transport system substrate-binding protein|nr:thiamine ABC transporter substrate-binding protein [Actinomycetota bacterium]